MKRRDFLAYFGVAAVATLAARPASAFATETYVSVVDPEAIIPSALEVRYEDCMGLRKIIDGFSQKSPLQLGALKFENIDALRDGTRVAMLQNVTEINNSVVKLQSEFSKLKREEILLTIDAGLSAAAVLISLTAVVVDSPLLVVGGGLLTAYSLGKYSYQVFFKEEAPNSLDTLSIVGGTRNTGIGILPYVSKLELHPSFGLYSAIHDVVMCLLATKENTKQYNLVFDRLLEINISLENAMIAALRARAMVEHYTSDNKSFLELLTFCQGLVRDQLALFIARNQRDSGVSSCSETTSIGNLEFFDHYLAIKGGKHDNRIIFK